MNLAEVASRCNNLALWKLHTRVWGYDMTACNGDRLLNLCMHRFGLMGRNQKKTFERLLRPGFTVVDVGANQGLYSLLFSSLVGVTGRVFSFEPEADLFAALRVNCRQNGATNIRCYNFALGARAEARVLYHSRVNSGDNRLARSDRPDWFYAVDVKTETLDSFLGDATIDFIKVDVQGWEFEVFKGMTTVWNNNPKLSIYFEFWPFGLRRAGSDAVQLLQHLRQNGFSLYDMAGLNMLPVTELSGFGAKFEGYKATNILAVRQLHDRT